MSQKEVLFLAHRIPYPPDKGDKIRSWRLLSHLCDHYDVHLAAFVDDPADFRHEEKLKKYCRSVSLVRLAPSLAKIRSGAGFFKNEALSLSYYSDPKMREVVRELRKHPLAAEIVFSSTMAQYIETPVPGRPRIIDFCDADSEKFSEYAETTAGPMQWVYKREGIKLAQAENAIANWADASFAITPAEAERFNHRNEITTKVDWWSNGVDTDGFDPDKDSLLPARAAEIVFTGAMDYRANVQAAVGFVENTWPHVRAARPQTTFAIVGANPVAQLRALDGRDGIVVTGRVPEIQPWLRHAKLAIAPLQIGRGVQNKVLEAMAMAKSVVATPAAAIGLVVSPDKDIIIADHPDAFAKAILDLLESEQDRLKIGAAARKRVVTDYQWSAQLKRFQTVLDSLAG